MVRQTHTGAELTISDAARLCGVDRRTLQRAVAAGRLTRTPRGQLTLEALIAAGYRPAAPHGDAAHHAAPAAQEMRHAAVAPQETPQGLPQELGMAAALMAHLQDLTSTIAALHQEVVLLREDLRQTPQRRPRIPWGTPQDAAHAPQEPPQEGRHAAGMPQGDAAPVPHHDALTPQETPQDVTPMPQGMPQETATPEPSTTLPPHILRIAEVLAHYERLSLAEQAQLLFDRGVYRAKDRKTGVEKPVDRGRLTRWLAQARQAGVL